MVPDRLPALQRVAVTVPTPQGWEVCVCLCVRVGGGPYLVVCPGKACVLGVSTCVSKVSFGTRSSDCPLLFYRPMAPRGCQAHTLTQDHCQLSSGVHTSEAPSCGQFGEQTLLARSSSEEGASIEASSRCFTGKLSRRRHQTQQKGVAATKLGYLCASSIDRPARHKLFFELQPLSHTESRPYPCSCLQMRKTVRNHSFLTFP